MTPECLYLLIGLFKALFATIVIETFVATFWLERSPRLMTVVIVANVLTNPALNLLVRNLPDAFFATDMRYYSMVGALEAVVWALEATIFYRFGGILSWRRALLFSLSLNGASFLSGFPLAALGYWG
ncbi:MAG: hypothetical protein Q4G03_05710 [Planctomycetia bacterium]|nr:hypothetical protein [Planctomycetia bacterium]